MDVQEQSDENRQLEDTLASLNRYFLQKICHTSYEAEYLVSVVGVFLLPLFEWLSFYCQHNLP